MALMLFFGATNTVVHKFQNELEYPHKETGVPTKYKHPFFQALCMFFAEFCCLGVFKIWEWYSNRQYGGRDKNPEIIEARQKGQNTEVNVLLIALPACFDIIGSSLMFLALTMIAASVYQMMRGVLVFIIAIMSVLFLKRTLYRHHWSSLFIILIGLILVGASPLIYPGKSDPDEDDDNTVYEAILGISLIIVAQLFSGCHFVTEEKLFSNYYLHPLKVVGWEGCWGVIIYSILLVILQFIPCNSDEICPYGHLEDTPQALYEWSKNSGIWISTIFYVISVACFNCLGVSITKYASAAQRSTIDTSRTAIIWMFFLAYQGPGHEDFIWLELVGFILLIFGTFVYNEILVLPMFGFNEYTKDALKAKNGHRESIQTKFIDIDQSFDNDVNNDVKTTS